MTDEEQLADEGFDPSQQPVDDQVDSEELATWATTDDEDSAPTAEDSGSVPVS
jgi:hypothetical protein